MEPERRPVRGPLAAAALLAAALAAGAWLSDLGPPGTLRPALGRFHPVVVHLPIGFLVALALVEVLAFRRGAPDRARARGVLLWGAAGTAVLGSILGYFLAREAEWDPELLERHQQLGVSTAAICLAAAVARGLHDRRGLRAGKPLYGLLLAGGLGTLVWTGHDGGSLTHGPDYLTELLRAEGPERPPEQAPQYARDIVPLLQAKCIPCHGPQKQEGKLRLDAVAEILEGGESQRPAVVPGDLSASYAVELVTRGRDQKGVMPPKGAPDLTRAELRTFLQWIYRGAPGLRPREDSP